ncbi:MULTISPECIES: hypothetical protein [Methanohalophilus]|jgi:hypothetical protein|uniref:Uncharacterized protein n=1 Tax=Methanohalophilus euhalobius TaxID=51203 RepID=A0A314ZY44_9EURY|nr:MULTISPECIES: hypothetical protein [Methanohalophilus]KXS40920.1 MAG: hypothetical protein AWU58_1827 [Methanohalophilus sp. T328-1]RSD34948.1 MAG: hypothetical protein CI953_487 [Methanohalophilus sp.]OBZ35742.1 MAG: hypothetical protein A9957_06330 [Methanohalophilus sp. DAL1]PQV43053.1 hypothetical protein B0H22_10362 [Methanohalophilus euhalobius]RNI09373.1 hypothetical protein EDD83_05335 [Methanohalophilus euhalobius]
MTHTKDRNVVVDIERNRLRVIISHGEDEEIIKLSFGEAQTLYEALGKKLEDYKQRQNLRID